MKRLALCQQLEISHSLSREWTIQQQGQRIEKSVILISRIHVCLHNLNGMKVYLNFGNQRWYFLLSSLPINMETRKIYLSRELDKNLRLVPLLMFSRIFLFQLLEYHQQPKVHPVAILLLELNEYHRYGLLQIMEIVGALKQIFQQILILLVSMKLLISK